MSILRMPAVKAETGHRSHASIYTAIKSGLFTQPVPIGQRSVGWPDDEVKAINAARMALRGDGSHFVSLDKVIKTMRETGADMKTKYKETARGGLAVNIVEC